MRTVALVLCLGGCVVAAQVQQTSVFKGGVSLVTVDVSVLDRDGKPVAGLTANDFDVKLGGKTSPVRTVDYLQVTAKADVPLQAQAQQTQVVTNGAPPKNDSRAFVLLVDDLSFDAIRGKAMFAAAGRFVSSLPATDYVGFTTSSQSRTVNPTTDRSAILNALRTAVGEFMDPRALNFGAGQGSGSGSTNVQHVVSIAEAVEIDKGSDAMFKTVVARECFGGDQSAVAGSLLTLIADNSCVSDVQNMARRTAAMTRQTVARQVQAYLGVLNAMRAAPGIKHLLIVSDGLALYDDVSGLTPVARAAAEAGVQLSVLMEEPDMRLSDSTTKFDANSPNSTTFAAADGGMMAARRNDDKAFAAGVETLAEITGGNFYRVVGSPDPFFDKIAVASSAVYRLGVEPPSDTKPGKDFTLMVTTRRPDLVVHANRHAVAPDPSVAASGSGAGSGSKPAAPVSVDDQLKTAISNGRVLYGVPVTVAAALRKTNNAATIDVGVSVQIPAAVKGPLVTMFGLVDDNGNTRSGRRALDPSPDGSDFLMSFAIPVAPGHWRVRVAVADAEGHVGSLESSLNVQFTKLGPFLASDLLTVWIDAAGKPQFLSLPDVPPGATVLDPSLELYPAPGATPPGDMHVRMTLVATGQSQPAIEKDVTPFDDNGTFRAGIEIPWASVPAGAYTLSAIVSIGGTEVGTVTATIRKK
jgi:VWFA-related protein